MASQEGLSSMELISYLASYILMDSKLRSDCNISNITT
jgi:hypothetical protein